MRNYMKVVCLVFAFLVTMAFANQKKAEALPLPVLDFGSLVNWDGTLSNHSTTDVDTVIYQNV